jgi:hypothetical protein
VAIKQVLAAERSSPVGLEGIHGLRLETSKTRDSSAKFNSPQSGHSQTVMLGFRQGLAPAYRVGPPVSI